MAHIDNPAQLAQLRVRYAAVEGALTVAQAAQAQAQSLARQYLDLLNALTGLDAQAGARIRVDWESGEVDVQAQEQPLNGLAV